MLLVRLHRVRCGVTAITHEIGVMAGRKLGNSLVLILHLKELEVTGRHRHGLQGAVLGRRLDLGLQLHLVLLGGTARLLPLLVWTERPVHRPPHVLGSVWRHSRPLLEGLDRVVNWRVMNWMSLRLHL